MTTSKVTLNEVNRLIVAAEAFEDGCDSQAYSAHNALEMIFYSLRQTDQRAREGMGLSENPPDIEPQALAALNEYFSTH